MTTDQNDTPEQPDYVVDRPQTSTRDYGGVAHEA